MFDYDNDADLDIYAVNGFISQNPDRDLGQELDLEAFARPYEEGYTFSLDYVGNDSLNGHAVWVPFPRPAAMVHAVMDEQELLEFPALAEYHPALALPFGRDRHVFAETGQLAGQANVDALCGDGDHLRIHF